METSGTSASTRSHYVHGHPSDNGTWQAGRNGNMPGIALPAKPKVGLSYARSTPRDWPRTVARSPVSTRNQVPAGHFKPALMTEDCSPIEPNVSELKFYAKGGGQEFLAVDVSGGRSMEQLVNTPTDAELNAHPASESSAPASCEGHRGAFTLRIRGP